MSLVVAAIEDGKVWMVSDTLITGGTVGLRDRVYELKIQPSLDSLSICGFAGDAAVGAKLMNAASAQSNVQLAIEILRKGTVDYPSIEFAHGVVDANGPHLAHITAGTVREESTLYLGVHEAFAQFQSIRHAIEIDPAPMAITKLMCAFRGTQTVPPGLGVAIGAMQRLFAERAERDIGGWALPYAVTREGVRLCSYSYSVSDPVLDRAAPGALIEHGTPAGGGFNLSITELGNNDGVVVYWVQGRRGLIFERSSEGSSQHQFDGTPSQFKEAAGQALGKNVDLWFGDKPAGPIKKLTIIRDEDGEPAIAIADHGDSLTFSALQTAKPFRATAALNFDAKVAKQIGTQLGANTNMQIVLSEDASTARAVISGDAQTELTLTAKDVDALILTLAQIRSDMQEAVPPEPSRSPGGVELVAIDPAWRSQGPSHPALAGIELRLRHPGLGWVPFLLPYTEARNLGSWLVQHAPAEEAEAQQLDVTQKTDAK